MTMIKKFKSAIIASAILGAGNAGCSVETTPQEYRQPEATAGRDPYTLSAEKWETSAAGPFGFLASTWMHSVKTFRPDVLETHSKAEVLKMRETCNDVLMDVVKGMTERNALYMEERLQGRSPDESDLQFAHKYGARTAVEMLNNPERPAVEIAGEIFRREKLAEQFVGKKAAETGMSSAEFVSQKKAEFKGHVVCEGLQPNPFKR